MKTGLKYITAIFTIVLISNIACTDYLLEDNKTGASEEVIYSTKSGLDGLLAASYSYLRGWYGKEAAFGLSEGGTDIWLTGYDNRQKVLIDYSGSHLRLQQVPGTMNACFDEFWELFTQR
jgi:hypothetical protein